MFYILYYTGDRTVKYKYLTCMSLSCILYKTMTRSGLNAETSEVQVMNTLMIISLYCFIMYLYSISALIQFTR